MEQQEEQIDPNLNADAYRNLSAADQPPINDRQLEVVITHEDGSMALGTSNMVSRYWNGTVWFYTDLSTLDCTKYAAALRTQSGVRVAAYLEKYDKFITGEDSGLLQVFELNSKTESGIQELRCVGYMCQHDSLTCISTFKDKTKIVTSGLDACIKLWDTAEMIATSSYNQAQTDIITSVEVQNESDVVFLSTSLDSEALLWDTRKTKPALGFWKKKGCGLTSASWKPNDDNIVAIGGDDGSISILDARYTGSAPIHELNEFPRGIHKLVFNPDFPSQLAGCCDSTVFKVFDLTKNCENVFENNLHKDFVRGLAWFKNDLITCSWDNSILRHSIKSEENV